MAEQRQLFSESWHRVAPQKIRLRPSVRVRRQIFRGQVWHVANDIYGDQFYRFRPEAWAFISRLDGTRTVEQIWEACVEREGDRAPGQGEVIQMLANLYQGNLIVSDFPTDVVALFERQKERHAREWKARLFGIFFLRIPLWDPDSFLNRTLKWVRPFLGWVGLIGWLILVGSGLAVVAGNWEGLTSRTAGVLEPGNLPLLLLAFVIAKLLHEFGHAYAVKRLGGEVHTMGITFLVFTPIPYVDATAAWAFRERWKRIWVGAAGMVVELALAAIAAFVWAATGPGTLNAWCYNLMLVASVSTLLFNINPLLKFDGYYILSDLTDTPNLQPRSMQQLRHWTERYAFGVRNSESPAGGRLDSLWLGGFGIASWCFRVFISFTIIMFVADRYLGLGFLAAVLTIIGLFVLPLYKGIAYLISDPKIERTRARAWSVTLGTVGLLVILLGLIPFPRHVRVPGILQSEGAAYAIAGAPGEIAATELGDGRVKRGMIIARLENPDLPILRRQLLAELARVEARERQGLASEGFGRTALAERRRSLELQLDEVNLQLSSLEVRAQVDGIWAGTHPRELMHRAVRRGEVLGEIIPRTDWRFLAILSQRDVSAIFESPIHKAGIRFPGSAGELVIPRSIEVVPGQQEYLPSPALGWRSKGPVELHPDDTEGTRAATPFFLVVIEVEEGARVLHHGRVGEARLTVDPEPLGFQWWRILRQMVQERFTI